MQIGIMAGHFPRPTLAETLAAVRAVGLDRIQFGFESAGISELAADPGEQARQVRAEFDRAGVKPVAVSGTFNMAHPDPEHRRNGLRQLDRVCSTCGDLGTSVVTLCTGTRNTESMWRPHPDNDSEDAWADLLQSMAAAVESADSYGVTLAFEPEVSNVVNSPEKARRLLDEIASPQLQVVMDGANVFPSGSLPRMTEILHRAFELLGADIALAHAKDLSRDGEAGHEAAGTGLLDYPLYIDLLKASGFQGTIVLHSLTEQQAPGCIQFLRNLIGSDPV